MPERALAHRCANYLICNGFIYGNLLEAAPGVQQSGWVGCAPYEKLEEAARGGPDGLLGQGFRAFAQAAAYCDSAFTPLPSSSSTWFLAWLSAMAFWIRAIASWAAMVASAAACAAAMVDPASP